MSVSIGFTGTRYGMTTEQRRRVLHMLLEYTFGCEFTAHHGDCIGADAEFHAIARARPGSRIVIHPGPVDDLARQAGCVGDERREPLPHMRRNRNIVRACTVLIAAPAEETQQPRGGTWRTVEMARQAGRPLALVLPSSAVSKERWP